MFLSFSFIHAICGSFSNIRATSKSLDAHLMMLERYQKFLSTLFDNLFLLQFLFSILTATSSLFNCYLIFSSHPFVFRVIFSCCSFSFNNIISSLHSANFSLLSCCCCFHLSWGFEKSETKNERRWEGDDVVTLYKTSCRVSLDIFVCCLISACSALFSTLCHCFKQRTKWNVNKMKSLKTSEKFPKHSHICWGFFKLKFHSTCWLLIIINVEIARQWLEWGTETIENPLTWY